MPIMTGDQKNVGRVSQSLVTRLTGWFVSAGAGAITSQGSVATSASGGQQFGTTVTRNAAGDFRILLHRGYKRLIRGDVTVSSATLGAVPGGANLGDLAVTSANYFTGATPVPASGGLGITTVLSSTPATPADPTAGVVVTYDIELADQ